MGSRERKRAERTKRKARRAERRGTGVEEAGAGEDTVSLAEQRAARSEARNQEVRDSLVPLPEGERPAIVTIGAVISVIISASVVIAYIAGAEVDGEQPNVFQVIAPAAIFAVTAYGMWKARYWAVLGFQAIALIIVLIAGLNLTGATSVTQAIGNTVVMAAAGTYFWFGVKAMARIQMPERP
jgi:hypothetical protein